VTDSFYHLADVSLSGRACSGLACFVARAGDERLVDTPPIHCLGKCYAAPATTETRGSPRCVVASPRSVVLERIANGGARALSEYVATGGYEALARAHATDREQLIETVERSGLRGRGGAGFPTGAKMRDVSSRDAPRVLVVNADEGDPGAYIDRILIEDDPHAVIEGMAIAARIVDAAQVFVYLRCEYPDARLRLETALDEARNAGVLGHGAPEFAIVVGRGSYVCGEETALLESIEGHRPFVRVRPPYPTERGLHGKPTLVQNVETLANLPFIVAYGAAAYASLGTEDSRGTKVFALNSLFVRPGLYEVELGTPLSTLAFDLGGGLVSGAPRGIIVGGPLAGIVHRSRFDVPLAFGALRAIGASLGHGGVIAFDERTTILELVHHVFEFGAFESCGRCTPCRLGARAIADATGAEASARLDESAFERLVHALSRTSLCGLGTGLGEFATSVLADYREELATCFA